MQKFYAKYHSVLDDFGCNAGLPALGRVRRYVAGQGARQALRASCGV
jgi:predicted naringenin-chalcone synthase